MTFLWVLPIKEFYHILKYRSLFLEMEIVSICSYSKIVMLIQSYWPYVEMRNVSNGKVTNLRKLCKWAIK